MALQWLGFLKLNNRLAGGGSLGYPPAPWFWRFSSCVLTIKGEGGHFMRSQFMRVFDTVTQSFFDRSSLKVWALNEILTYWTSIVNQLTEWLNDLMRHFGTRSTQGTRRLKGPLGTRNSKDTRALGHSRHLRYSDTQRALGHSGTEGTQALGH